MGWLFTHGATKKDIIKERTVAYEDGNVRLTTLAHCIRGNCLWIVKEVLNKKVGSAERFIELDLLEKSKGDDWNGWGYKDMDESMGPYYYSCPVAYLDMVPVVTNQAWRDQVREHAAKKARKLELGATYSLIDGCNPKTLRIISLKPLRGYSADGRLYRTSKKYLKDKIEDPIKWKTIQNNLTTI